MRSFALCKSLPWFSLLPVLALGVACGEDGGGGDMDGGTGECAGQAGMAGQAGAAGRGGAAGAGGAPMGGNAGMAGTAGMEGGAPASGDAYVVTSANRLLFVNRATGHIASARAIAGLASGESLLGADFRPADGKLYAVSSAAKLYTLDLATAAATYKATLVADAGDSSDAFTTLAGTDFGVDFNPVADRLRVVSDSGQNLRINADTGATTTDGVLNPGAPHVTAAAYTLSFASACRTRLYVIDGAAKTLLVQDPPNDGRLTAVGTLGAATVSGSLNGFEIVTGEDGANHAFAVFSSGSGAQIYDVDLTSGAATNARALTLDAGEAVRALSAAPPATAPAQAVGELLGVSVSNQVVSFNRGAPGKLCTASDIRGLAAHEQVLGIDVRPADGALYALGSTGKLYTLDPSSGAASVKATLRADPADTTTPFTSLSGADFGVGFNPVPDRLRVTSDTGQNLRINVDTGAVTTDASVNPGSPRVSAVAYTNSFAGTKSTTLYGIDSKADALVRIGGDPASGGACPADAANPNCGVVSPVGALNAGDVSGVDGFDIDARSGALGSAVAALHTGSAASSSLFVIDLTTGAATTPTGVANPTIGGGERLRGLTYAGNPRVTAYALTTAGRLLGFAPSAPSTALSDVAISGLASGETLLGLDFRPLDGRLYALSSCANLYTVAPTTGAVTRVATLSAAPNDDYPFTALNATANYGVDFNPAADLLRAVNDSGVNLRVVPAARPATGQAAGATFTDATLNPATPMLVAAAYTNNFAGTAGTTLFGLDLGSDMLVRQGGAGGTPSPNAGLITNIGPLGVPATADAGFDIAGGHNGLALAALSTAGGAAELYSVNLSSGTATPFNASNNQVGGNSAQAVRGLALELK